MRVAREGVRGWAVAGAIACAVACRGSTDAAPSPNAGDGATTIAITASGVSPKNVTVARGSQVTFVNSDSRMHEMHSDPHPEHGDCPEIDHVGHLDPGQSRQTGNLNTPRTCGYHDHLQSSSAALKGTITIF